MIMPKLISFNLWASQLNIDYPNDTIPFPPSDGKWKEWANQLLISKSFATAGIAAPTDNETWEEWASKVYQIMG